jgi:tetratricopeptide (TPR) repeat protein
VRELVNALPGTGPTVTADPARVAPYARDELLTHGAKRPSVAAAAHLLHVEQNNEVVAPAPVVAITQQWQIFAQQGEYDASLASLEANGGFEGAIDQATADQLMLLVDVARVTGHRELAVEALRRVISQHGSDPLAPLAAWTLGNLLDKAGDHEGAADAFAAYRTLSPQGDFAEDALAREIRMAVERRDESLAKGLAAQYEQAFPNGRRAQEIREQLAELRSPGAGARIADAGAPDSPENDSPQAGAARPSSAH